MGLNWSLHSDETDYLIVKALVRNAIDNSSIVREDGVQIDEVSNTSSFSSVDQQVLESEYIYVSIPSDITDYDTYFSSNNFTLDYDKDKPVILAGNENKKDILSRNSSTNRWEKIKNFEVDYKIDGSDNWQYDSKGTGTVDGNDYHVVKLDITGWNFVDQSHDGRVKTSNLVDYNGNHIPLNGEPSGIEWADLYSMWADTNIMYISIGIVKSGWLSTMTPTADMIKGYFNGWQYTGDGTTHSWVSIVDGTTTPSTQTAAFVADPANSLESYENYFLSYQLSESQTINVDHLVEGSLSIEGDAQISVNSGGEYFESLTPDTTGQATLAHSASEVFGVYDGSAYIDFTVVDADNIQITNYDDTKSYTANYMRQDRYNFTTNMNDVTVHYASSLKSAFQQNVTKTGDIATDVSILDRQMLDVLIRLDALESGGTS